MDYTLQWPEFGAGANIKLTKLVHHKARVEFPDLESCGIENRSGDDRLAHLLFGESARQFIDLRDNPPEFAVRFNKTSLPHIPVGVRDRMELRLYYDRDGVPSCTAFDAEVVTLTLSFVAPGEDCVESISEAAPDDSTVVVYFRIRRHFGRLPITGVPQESSASIEEIECGGDFGPQYGANDSNAKRQQAKRQRG